MPEASMGGGAGGFGRQEGKVDEIININTKINVKLHFFKIIPLVLDRNKYPACFFTVDIYFH